MNHFYRPQTKFAKVMFLQVSVILSTGGRAWLLLGGMHGCSGGCMVAPEGLGGVRGCSGGHAWLLKGHAWLLPGGVACVVFSGGDMRGFFDEIRSMSGRYASYWNAFLSFDFFIKM